MTLAELRAAGWRWEYMPAWGKLALLNSDNTLGGCWMDLPNVSDRVEVGQRIAGVLNGVPDPRIAAAIAVCQRELTSCADPDVKDVAAELLAILEPKP